MFAFAHACVPHSYTHLLGCNFIISNTLSRMKHRPLSLSLSLLKIDFYNRIMPYNKMKCKGVGNETFLWLSNGVAQTRSYYFPLTHVISSNRHPHASRSSQKIKFPLFFTKFYDINFHTLSVMIFLTRTLFHISLCTSERASERENSCGGAKSN
jgi:hypothetical protein